MQSVKILPKVITPIYSTGFNSGLIVNLGVLNSSIIPINEGLPYFDMKEEINLNYTDLEREFKSMIIEDNITNPLNPKIPKIKNIDIFCESLNMGLDDLMTRSMFCVNRKITELMKNPIELKKLNNELNKVDHNFGSFFSNNLRRVQIGTKFFGDINDEDQINIAYSLLKCIKNLPCEDRKKLSSNIILNGGLTMTVGFYKRFV
jgi:actin-related protein 10